MNANDTITITRTYQVTRSGDKFTVDGRVPRTREQWAAAGERWVGTPDCDIAHAMVAYIDSLPVDEPQGYGFLGTLDVNGEEYDVMRTGRDYIYAASRAEGKYLTFPTGRVSTSDWSDILAAGTFTPRSDAQEVLDV